MTVISSIHSRQVKYVRQLMNKSKVRRTEGLFVVEGIRMFSEIPRLDVEKVYVSESFLKVHKMQDLLPGFCCETVTDSVMAAMSDTKTPQGILALVRQKQYTLEAMMKAPGAAHLLLLERLQDPGNLGTILRSGEGAGITGMIMDQDTADIYNPKVIRSTMGSVFRVPFLYVNDLSEVCIKLKNKGIAFYAAHLEGRVNYDEMNFTGPCGFMIGNEASGLSAELAGLADAYVKIPMAGKVESLNAAVAASVLMFETARQRRKY